MTHKLKTIWEELTPQEQERVSLITGWNKQFIKLVVDLKKTKRESLSDTLSYAINQAQKDIKIKTH